MRRIQGRLLACRLTAGSVRENRPELNRPDVSADHRTVVRAVELFLPSTVLVNRRSFFPVDDDGDESGSQFPPVTPSSLLSPAQSSRPRELDPGLVRFYAPLDH